MQTTGLCQPAMASTVPKMKTGGWQRVVAWCAAVACCLWLVSIFFSPGRPADTTAAARGFGDASSGASAQPLLQATSAAAADSDAAHAAILQRFLQLYGSAPPRVSEIAVATGPQQSQLGDDDGAADERSEDSDDTQQTAQFGRSDLPVATPFRQTDREGAAEGGPADVQAPEANELQSGALDSNAAAAVLGEEQTRERTAPSRDSLELTNRGENNYTVIDYQARQDSTGGTKSVIQAVDSGVSGVKYDYRGQWWPLQPDNRGPQLPGNMDPVQSSPQDAPMMPNDVSANVDTRWRDSATFEAYAHSPTQRQRLQHRTIQVQSPLRPVYIPEGMMWRYPQEYPPVTRSKNPEVSFHTREEMQQPVLYYSRSPEQFTQNGDYRNSPAMASKNINYPSKFAAWDPDSYEGAGRHAQRYNARETPEVGGQKLFGRRYLSVSETMSQEATDTYDENTGIIQKGSDATENKSSSENVAQSNEGDNVLHVTSRSLTNEGPPNGNSYEVTKDKEVFIQDLEVTSADSIDKLGKTEGKVLDKNPKHIEERQSVIQEQNKRKSAGESVKLQEYSTQYKEAKNVRKVKSESVIQKKAGVIREKNEGLKGKLKCPDGDLVSVQDGGRLGNKLWEYAAVWALPRVLPELNKTAVVPRSLLKALSKLFHNLSLPALEDLPEDCPARRRLEASEPVKRWRLEPLSRALPAFAERPLLLHRWIVLAEPVLARLDELRAGDFRLRPELAAGAQRALWALRRRSGVPDHARVTFVGVHVRRTDFSSWLPRVYNRSLADASYFSAGMALCRARARLWKGGRALFAVASDDPGWCERHLADGGASRDVLVARGGSPEQDLALLAACNQSLLDYGTFGQWAALLAGGPAVSLRLDPHVDEHLARMPGWTLA
ncbi:uncharacterized protein LOC126278418 [Schistocerca gregaria]|uniref:uncharacterized protein LOC126278418 n=1 Tax=Schistocerca gregaria TaxID=7010 RepID=UPI00211DC2E5|nr:uncharacterized protein LOC126278418 [Schistocerca gregaria]